MPRSTERVAEERRTAQTGVSVVITNYNYGEYLDEAITSVLQQTLPATEKLLSLMMARPTGALSAGPSTRMVMLGLMSFFRRIVVSQPLATRVSPQPRSRSLYASMPMISLHRSTSQRAARRSLLILGVALPTPVSHSGMASSSA
jgi:hypothetical protein